MAQKKKPTRHRSALKAARQAVTHNLYNRGVKKQVRLAVRAVTDAAAAKNTTDLEKLLSEASSAIDKAAQKGVIHWKQAARKKSRLAIRMASVSPAK